ncbi:Uncharacterised protein [Mycobacteroides abscessus subsp. abscessus]|nr:Uncharacterised protein [Mycobacteroides abscessus subsp. abscessus]
MITATPNGATGDRSTPATISRTSGTMNADPSEIGLKSNLKRYNALNGTAVIAATKEDCAIKPAVPQRNRRAAAKVTMLPRSVTVPETNSAKCGGEASTASNPYTVCHHRSRSPYSRNDAAPQPESRKPRGAVNLPPNTRIGTPPTQRGTCSPARWAPVTIKTMVRLTIPLMALPE